MDCELVGFLLKKHEGVAVFAGFEVPSTGVDQAQDEVEGFACGQRVIKVFGGVNFIAIECSAGGVVEGGAVAGGFIRSGAGFEVGAELAGASVDEGFSAGIEGVEGARESAGGGRGDGEKVRRSRSGRGVFGEDFDLTGVTKKAPADSVGQRFARAQDGLGRERSGRESEEKN